MCDVALAANVESSIVNLPFKYKPIDFHRETWVFFLFVFAYLSVRVCVLVGASEKDGEMSGRDFLSTCTKNVGLKQ